ncbi:hypothetical protein, partial [Ralstonia wenshanensis]|uniref:hypothetical protein n=1 Tax=Ralstonia wenshanensis TaxID=2842456 RepID=UPI0029302D4B
FGVSLRTHCNSCLTSSLRLTGVYWQRGDSVELGGWRVELEGFGVTLECWRVEIEGFRVEFQSRTVELEGFWVDFHSWMVELEGFWVDFHSWMVGLEGFWVDFHSWTVELEGFSVDFQSWMVGLEGFSVEFGCWRVNCPGPRECQYFRVQGGFLGPGVFLLVVHRCFTPCRGRLTFFVLPKKVSKERGARCGDPLLEFLSQGGRAGKLAALRQPPLFFLLATEIQGAA